MKKTIAVIICIFILTSVFCIGVNAEDGGEDKFIPFGEVEAMFDADADKKITFDGNIADWAANNYRHYELDQYNFDAWRGEIPENFKIDLYYTADAEYLYVAFNVFDDDVFPCRPNSYGAGVGDSFQIQLDFNGSAAATKAFEMAVFYSFGFQEDGTIDIIVQCVFEDGRSDVSYQYTSEDIEWQFVTEGMAPVKNPIKGMCAKTLDGWCAEFAISWKVLYGCALEKLATDEKCEAIPFVFDKDHPISLPMLICYLDVDGSASNLAMAAGTSNEKGSLISGSGWAPENAGATLIVKCDDDNSKINIDTTPVTAPETEEQTEAVTTAGIETKAETIAEGETSAVETESETNAKTKSKGCGGAIGGFAVLAVLTLGYTFGKKSNLR